MQKAERRANYFGSPGMVPSACSLDLGGAEELAIAWEMVGRTQVTLNLSLLRKATFRYQSLKE
jgi:hypothetical protein